MSEEFKNELEKVLEDDLFPKNYGTLLLFFFPDLTRDIIYNVVHKRTENQKVLSGLKFLVELRKISVKAEIKEIQEKIKSLYSKIMIPDESNSTEHAVEV